MEGFISHGAGTTNRQPSVSTAYPFLSWARSSMGVRGANFPGRVRGIVAIFWVLGLQTLCLNGVGIAAQTQCWRRPPMRRHSGHYRIWLGSYCLVAYSGIALSCAGRSGLPIPQLAGRLVYVGGWIALMLTSGTKPGPHALEPKLGSIFSGSAAMNSGRAGFFCVGHHGRRTFAAVVIITVDLPVCQKRQQMDIGTSWPAGLALAILFTDCPGDHCRTWWYLAKR